MQTFLLLIEYIKLQKIDAQTHDAQIFLNKTGYFIEYITEM